jgi:protein-tyrosine phosphatase
VPPVIWPFRRPELRVLIVCTANICRSPVAAMLLDHQLRTIAPGRRVAVTSAGTAVAAPGAPPDPRMVVLAGESGVRFRRVRARPLTVDLLVESDLVWVMEPDHAQAVGRIDSSAAARTDLFDPQGDAVPDPFYSDPAGVRAVFERLEALAAVRAAEIGRMLAARS